MIFAHTASAFAPVTMLVAVMAPGFTSAFISGAPCRRRCDPFDRDDRVEPRARRIDADSFLDRLGTLLLDDLRHREDLGDRLDRDLGLDVAGRIDFAVDGDQRDAEQIRIDFGERRNVVRVLAFLEVLELLECAVDGGLRIGRLLGDSAPRLQRRHAGERCQQPCALDSPRRDFMIMTSLPTLTEKLYLNEN